MIIITFMVSEPEFSQMKLMLLRGVACLRRKQGSEFFLDALWGLKKTPPETKYYL